MRTPYAVMVLVVALGGGAAGAQPREPPLGQTLKGDARREYELGRDLYRSGDNAGSLAKFSRAYELSRDPRLLWNMSVCHKNLHHYDKALPLVEEYLASTAPLSAAERSEASEFRDALTSLVAPVTITSVPAGAEVFLDGERLGTTPFERPVLVVAGVAGAHHFRFHLGGYKEQSLSPDLPGGTPFNLRADLEKEPREGRLVVVAKSRDAIFLDGRLVGATEWSGTVTSAPHVVVVSAEGKKSARHEVTVHDNEQRSLYVDLEPEGAAKWPWIVGGGAVVAAGLLVGGYFLFRPTSTPGPTTHGSIGTYQVP